MGTSRCDPLRIVQTVQVIEQDGRAVAIIASGQAIVLDELEPAMRRRVQTKCLFALEIAAGKRPGPYQDADAARYADAVLGGSIRSGGFPHGWASPAAHRGAAPARRFPVDGGVLRGTL